VINTDLDTAGAGVGTMVLNGVTRSPLNNAGQVVFLANGRVYVGSAGSSLRLCTGELLGVSTESFPRLGV
jgi:hypothetical protein